MKCNASVRVTVANTLVTVRDSSKQFARVFFDAECAVVERKGESDESIYLRSSPYQPPVERRRCSAENGGVA